MRLLRPAPVGAVTAVVGGVALLGASLGGIVSVDRELAAAVPAPAASQATAPVRFVPEVRSERRLVRFVDESAVVLVLDRRDAAERCAHGNPHEQRAV